MIHVLQPEACATIAEWSLPMVNSQGRNALGPPSLTLQGLRLTTTAGRAAARTPE